MEALRVEGLNYIINDLKICNDINIKVEKDSFTGIIGPNGSGKSTLLKQIYRVLKPTSGSIYLDGKDIFTMSNKETAKNMGVLAQENQTDFQFTVEEIVLMGRAAYHNMFQRETSEDLEILYESLDKVGMLHKHNQIFTTLSGGEKQRVLLARALAQKTHFLILDEPTNHLDIGYQFQMMELLSEFSMTIFSAIHDLNLAAKFCDWLILLNKGKIVSQGTPEEVLTEDMMRKVFNVDTIIDKDERTSQLQITFIGTAVDRY